jgi:hypothetical protein
MIVLNSFYLKNNRLVIVKFVTFLLTQHYLRRRLKAHSTVKYVVNIFHREGKINFFDLNWVLSNQQKVIKWPIS